MMIDEVGNVYPCALLNSSEYKLCSIFNLKTLEEALEKFKCGYESNLMKYQAEYFEACRDCNVNLFCWSCIEEIGRLSKHPEKFKLRCENNKKMLEKLVW
jgi:radical SAM protein with 4Fe4S-binding SPASM domain